MSYQLDVIDLVPDGVGGYAPTLDVQTPTTGAIVPYTPNLDLSPVPATPQSVPRYDSGTRGMTDQDIADFGVDANGNPVVRRNPRTGRIEFNPGVDASPATNRAFNDALDDAASRNPGNRASRRRAGQRATGGRAAGVAAALGAAQDLRDGAGLQGAFEAIASINPTVGISLAASDLLSPISDAAGNAIADFVRSLPGGPSGNVSLQGEVQFQGGQCPGSYSYSFDVSGTRTSTGESLGPTRRSISYTGPLLGLFTANPDLGDFQGGYVWGVAFRAPSINGRAYPRGPLVTPNSALGNRLGVSADDPYQTGWVSGNGGGGGFIVEGISISNVSGGRSDGGSDNCGDLRGPANTQPVAPTTTADPPITPTYPPSLPGAPGADGLPGAPGADGLPRTDAPDLPNLDIPDLPGIDDIPESDGPPDTPDPPTPDSQCCPSTERSLSTIEDLLRDVLAKLQGSASGVLDLALCGANESDIRPFGGEGLEGLYDSILAIAQQLQLTYESVKCPPEAVAALPMHWEAKRGEIPQLVVIWRKVEGGGSTWSMTIPHPREEIGPDYAFNFPEYKKGGNMASVRLTDNSQIIINAFSEPEAQKVVDYITTLIDPAYLPETGVKMVYSKNVGDYAEVDVKAEYVKSFLGHKTTAPQWAKRISE